MNKIYKTKAYTNLVNELIDSTSWGAEPCDFLKLARIDSLIRQYGELKNKTPEVWHRYKITEHDNYYKGYVFGLKHPIIEIKRIMRISDSGELLLGEYFAIYKDSMTYSTYYNTNTSDPSMISEPLKTWKDYTLFSRNYGRGRKCLWMI